MTITASDSRPATSHRAKAAVRTQLLTNAAVTVPVGLLGYQLWQAEKECDDGFACLGDAFVAAAFTMLVAPVVIWLLLRLFGVPRAFLVSLVTVTVGHVLADGAAKIQQARQPELGSEAPMAPWWVYVVVAVASAVLGIAVAGGGEWGIFVRVGAALLVLLAFVVVEGWLTAARTEHRQSELAEVPVTPYLPDLGPHSEPQLALASDRGITIDFSYEDPAGGAWDFPEVVLTPTTGNGPCADAETAGFYASFDGSACVPTRDGFVAHDGYNDYVGVVRGQTTLMARYDASVLDEDAVAEALRDAPPSSVEELARL